MVLMVGVVYRTRLLQLAWVVYKGKKGHTIADRHIEVLKKMQPLLPEGVEVVLLGDAEYDTSLMLSWFLSETSWQFVMRIASNVLVQQVSDWQKIGSFKATQGRLRMIQVISLTKTELSQQIWWFGGEQSMKNPFS